MSYFKSFSCLFSTSAVVNDRENVFVNSNVKALRSSREFLRADLSLASSQSFFMFYGFRILISFDHMRCLSIDVSFPSFDIHGLNKVNNASLSIIITSTIKNHCTINKSLFHGIVLLKHKRLVTL